MFELPGYQTLDLIDNTADIRLYRLLRQEDGLRVIAKTTIGEYPGAAMVDAFRHEYDMLKRLCGRGAIEAYSLEIMADRPVLLLKDIEGSTLGQILRMPVNSLGLPALLRIATAIADCLMQIHREKITLNELTPAHLIVNPITFEVKFIDIRMCSTENITSPLSPLSGRPDVLLPYIAPEQTGRTGVKPDYRSDFYSLGIILYECLSGSRPFELHDVVDIVYRHLADTPEPLHRKFPTIPLSVSDIVGKCMEKMPEARYASALGIKSDFEECLSRLEESGHIEPFPLGSWDIPERWMVSGRFYGRHLEQQSLREALQRASQGAVETVWISGESGIGKTTFLKETLRNTVSLDGFFARGKFESRHTSLPYGIWHQVIEELVSQLLMETKLQVEVWKLRILQAVDNYGQLLIDFVPKLELLIGPQPSVPSLPPLEAQHRFQLIMSRFIQLFPHEDHPLILVLDNLQWADDTSLQYLTSLIEDTATTHLLIVLSYRNREITRLHPLSRLEKHLIDRNVAMSRISLQALELTDLKQLLLDVMRYEAADLDELARVLLHKTDGNPLFIKQFLQDLIDDQRVEFDENIRSWKWDLQRITELNVPDNVASYLSSKLQQFPEQTVYALSRAAFIGSLFDLRTLADITETPIEALSEALAVAVHGRLLQPVNGEEYPHYKFQHNRIHQAAYAFISEEERSELHWKIGLLLLGRSPLSEGTTLFEAVQHLNQALTWLDRPEQRLQLVELNLQAGVKAKQTTAHETALQYMLQATSLLAEQSWEAQYGLTFRVFRERAELEYLCSHFDTANELFHLLIDKATTNMDKAYVYAMKVQLEASNDNHEEVISLGQHTLSLLKVKHQFDPGYVQLTLQWLRLRRRLKKVSLESLTLLPPMTDEARRIAMSTLDHSSNACFYVNREGWLASSFTMIELTLDYGMTPEASIGFIGYAMFQYYYFRNDEETFKWAMLAFSLSEPYPKQHMTTLAAFAMCYDSWRHYDPAMLHTFTEKAGKVGLESGDLWKGNQNVLINCASLLQFGHPLGDIYERLITHSGDLLRHNNSLHCKQAIVAAAILVRLTGYRSIDDPFPIAEISEPDFAKSVHGDTFDFIQEMVWIYQYLTGYVFGEYREASEALAKSAAIIKSREDGLDSPMQIMYECLVWAQLYEEYNAEEQRTYRAKMRKCLKKMKNLAMRCPGNYQHKYLLMKAELTRLSRDPRQAEALYEQSIETARVHGHIHDLAMAAECYGKYGLRHGKMHLARIYMTEAYEAYLQWGAKAKAADLEQQHRHLLHIKREPGLDRVDSLSVVMSAQALSGEMEMSRLLATLMRIMLHNAGAEYGAVIFDHDGKWMVEAYGTSEAQHIESVPLGEESGLVPAAIIAYAARTQEQVVLHDALSEGIFTRNTYVRNNRLKSVLCLPIMNQNKLVCLLYLENNLSPGVFTPSRLDVLKLLGSQCAISIANAKLYSGIQYLKKNLEDQVVERTRSLERSMRETSAALAEATVFEERNRIAQEIHDIVGHTLTSTILQIEAGKRLLQKKEIDSGFQRLAEAQDLVRHSLNEIRGSVHMLKEDRYSDLTVMLRQLIKDTERNAGVVVHAVIYDLPEAMSTAYKKAIYHALQEGLTNGIRHGKSAEFHFSLESVGANLQFRLKDCGLGMSPIVMGFGLRTMKERVEQLGGSLSIDSEMDEGCLLEIDLPMRRVVDRT
ncbi:histidine kinase [Paenibacillus odorifer]|uniref:AAA family ATPase n=1 Tax=Paenibacillus TaxID=44249 RepID=UPI0003E1F382|nr:MULTISPECIES: AAA family ATPase [Paenibacillus]ETT59596.1 multi-sensor signal transduction multi-kinase [Paenibacillus sp. FSL H8-237]OMD12507.1 histidine kinase [Paenibacillus odorifer]OME61654.1 histidine kinase [Paenibacillus odorifer]OME63951.1 histidine kinase [Paenibacillus odorifer]